MKCPKCGYTSFDFLENCKKCGIDLQNHKSKFGLRSLIFPGFQTTEQAPSLLDETSEGAQDAAAGEATDFGFDFMSDEEPVIDESAFAEEDASEEETLPPFEEETERPLEEKSPVDAADLLADDEEIDQEFAPQDDTEEDEAFGELPADEEIDFENWESEEPDDEDKPKSSAGEEGPSDPFDFRESAEGGQAPEPASLTEPTPGTEAAPFAAPGPEDQPEPTAVGEQSELFSDLDPASDLAGEDESSPRPPATVELDAPPPAEATDPAADIPDGTEPVVPIPSLGARLAAGLTDLLIVAAIFLVFLVVGERTVPDPAGPRLLPSADTLMNLAIPYFLVLFALCFGYFTLFHFLTGQTPGKMLFRLRVENLDGGPLLFSQAFLRSTGGLVSLLTAGAGYLAALFNAAGRGWNDQLAGSRLVPLLAEEIDEDDLAPLDRHAL